MRLSYILTNYNQAQRLENCLIALSYQQADFEVFLFDDGSTDNSKEIIEQFTDRFPIYPYYLKHTGSLAFMYNLGARYAQGDVLAFGCTDFVFLPDFAKRALAAHEQLGKAIVMGIWNPLSAPVRPTGTHFLLSWFDLSEGKQSYSQERTVKNGLVRETQWMGACHPLSTIKKRDWRPRNESIPLYYTDWEWAIQCKEAGFELYWCPMMQAFHQYHPRPGRHGGFDREREALEKCFHAPYESIKACLIKGG